MPLDRVYRSGESTYISSQNQTGNFYTSAQLVNGTLVFFSTPFYFRSLLKFDLRDIPIGTTVNSASLKLFYQSSSGSPVSATFYCRKCTKNFVTAESTWNKYNSSSNWSSVGGDFSLTDQGTFVTSSLITDIEFTDITALVVDALGGDGFLRLGIIGPQALTTQQITIHSFNATNEMLRPTLTINITPPAGTLVRIAAPGISSQALLGITEQFKINPAMEFRKRRRGNSIQLARAKPVLVTRLAYFQTKISGTKYLDDEFQYIDPSMTMTIKSITGIPGFEPTNEYAIPISYVPNSDRSSCSNIYLSPELVSGV